MAATTAKFSSSLGAFTRATAGRMQAVQRGAAQDFAEAISIGNQYSTGTPVDTGYARASWIASIGTASTALPVGPRPKVAVAGQYAANTGAFTLAIAGWRLGETLYLSNNVGYLRLLELGVTVPKSARTPPGFIGQARQQWQPMVVKNADLIRAETRAGRFP